ncbi:MAG TPA: SAM-dependent methyltransferase [Clostridiales bacterium]|nr:MAG: hypothetical protein A2Y18_03005 [Clostridiales bacterium GWD2_32_19]HCC06646.1 SAM-dependent methyltransferase [Clostridiales bacterium]
MTDITKEYYENNAKQYFDNTYCIDFSSITSVFEKYLKQGDSILDLGCGSGRDSKYFNEQGYNVTPLDYSENLAKLTEIYTGLKVEVMDMRDMKYKEQFDAIFSAGMMHIKKDEIKYILEKCFDALKSNGVFYLTFKYGNKEEIIDGRFFNFYTEETLIKLLDSIPGNNVKEVWISGDTYPGRDTRWINVITQKKI